jgi:glucose-1-phosphate cytidylyltransferase
MKAVILAGGFGTRLGEETVVRPKPMVEIGGRPILWHIMKLYSFHGIQDFVICLGYKGYMIKEYFAHYALHMSDVTLELCTGKTTVHRNLAEPWRVTLLDTGEETMTGGRLKRARAHLGEHDFCCTYGDGVADVDIGELLAFHRRHGRLATLTATQPPGRFGALRIEEDLVTAFQEKPAGDGAWVNGGFFVASPRALDEYVAGDQTIWEREPMERLARDGQLAAYPHRGFWHPMDTTRDKAHLEELWRSGHAPWKVWL